MFYPKTRYLEFESKKFYNKVTLGVGYLTMICRRVEFGERVKKKQEIMYFVNQLNLS